MAAKKCTECVRLGFAKAKRTVHASGLCVDHRTPATSHDTADQKRTGRIPAFQNEEIRQRLLTALQAAARRGEPVTGALVASLAGTSVRTGRRRLAALREQFPNQLQKPPDQVEGM